MPHTAEKCCYKCVHTTPGWEQSSKIVCKIFSICPTKANKLWYVIWMSIPSALKFRGFRASASNLKPPVLGQISHTELRLTCSGNRTKIRNAAYWHADAHDKQLDLLYAVMVVSLSGSLSLVAHSPLIEIAPPGIYIQSCWALRRRCSIYCECIQHQTFPKRKWHTIDNQLHQAPSVAQLQPKTYKLLFVCALLPLVNKTSGSMCPSSQPPVGKQRH